MSNKIFVANFPFSTTQDELADLFSQHGSVVSVKVATDRDTGRSRGFGFVEMASAEEATTAIEALNGQDLGGRNLAVRVAEDRRGGPGGGGGGRPRRGPGGGRFGGGGYGGGGGGYGGGGGGYGGGGYGGGGGGYGGGGGGYGGGGRGGDRYR